MENKRPKQVNPNTAPPHEFLKYVDELETYANKLEEQLRLYSVSNRRELLIDFCSKVDETLQEYGHLAPDEKYIDEYLKGN
jgi:hypothetical protein